MLAVVATLSWQLGGMLGWQLVRERSDAIRGIAEGMALIFGKGMHARLREVELLAQSHHEARRPGLEPLAWRTESERLKTGRPHYAWIGVTDAGGTVGSASGGLLVGQDVSSRPWFQGAPQGSCAGDVHKAKLLAQPLPARADGEPLHILDFAAPLRTSAGTVKGTLGAHVDWRWAQDIIARLRPTRGTQWRPGWPSAPPTWRCQRRTRPGQCAPRSAGPRG